MTGSLQSVPDSLRSTASTAASSVEEHLHPKTRTCASSMFRNPYSDHFDLFAGLKSEQTLEKEAVKDGYNDLMGKVDSVAGEAKTAITEKIAPWQKPQRKGAADRSRQSRHCECSLGEAWDSMFKKQPGVVQDAEQKVIEAGHKIEEEAQEAGRVIRKKSLVLESTIEKETQEAGRLIKQKSSVIEKEADELGAHIKEAAKSTQDGLQKAGDAASKAAEDGVQAAQKVASGAGQAAQRVADQAADAIVKNPAK